MSGRLVEIPWWLGPPAAAILVGYLVIKWLIFKPLAWAVRRVRSAGR